MKVIIDEAVPYIRGVIEPFADVEYRKGREIDRSAAMDADALIVRTRTKCGRELLEGTPVRMVATATAGRDHIDEEWCRSAGIAVASVPGCNAGGVVQYFFTALYWMAEEHGISLSGRRIGIIGAGNVGGRIAMLAPHFGFDVVLCDPPRAAREGGCGFVGLDELLAVSDIVTLHVPLDASTRGMADAKFFHRMRKKAIFVNASRGEVVDESALRACRDGLAAVALDVWNGEPDVAADLVASADVATPHIAGYSLAGKVNATVGAVRAFARCFGIRELEKYFPADIRRESLSRKLSEAAMRQDAVARELTDLYPIWIDSGALKGNVGEFERLRTEYQFRTEFYV